MRSPLIVFCTDGAPRDPYFWQAYGSRERYGEIRKQEAAAAAKALGIGAPTFMPIMDQQLYLNLSNALSALEKIAEDFRPNAILTLSYEGGHPDHDSCALLSHVLGGKKNLPVWEAPLYHRTSAGAHPQQFLVPSDPVMRLRITARELERKISMGEAYRSQAGILTAFDLKLELFRPQFPYDFCQPPSTDVINYEFWQWTMKARDVANEFKNFLNSTRTAEGSLHN